MHQEHPILNRPSMENSLNFARKLSKLLSVARIPMFKLDIQRKVDHNLSTTYWRSKSSPKFAKREKKTFFAPL